LGNEVELSGLSPSSQIVQFKTEGSNKNPRGGRQGKEGHSQSGARRLLVSMSKQLGLACPKCLPARFENVGGLGVDRVDESFLDLFFFLQSKPHQLSIFMFMNEKDTAKVTSRGSDFLRSLVSFHLDTLERNKGSEQSITKQIDVNKIFFPLEVSKLISQFIEWQKQNLFGILDFSFVLAFRVGGEFYISYFQLFFQFHSIKQENRRRYEPSSIGAMTSNII
jgi:hypothetical protein